MNASAPRESEWERGWDGHERRQQRRLAQLTLAEKIEWLEQAQRIVESLQSSPASRAEPD